MKSKTNYRELSIKEILKIKEDLKNKLREARIEKIIGSNFNPAENKKNKRDYARILTILREHELGIRRLKED